MTQAKREQLADPRPSRERAGVRDRRTLKAPMLLRRGRRMWRAQASHTQLIHWREMEASRQRRRCHLPWNPPHPTRGPPQGHQPQSWSHLMSGSLPGQAWDRPASEAPDLYLGRPTQNCGIGRLGRAHPSSGGHTHPEAGKPAHPEAGPSFHVRRAHHDLDHRVLQDPCLH